MYLRIIYDDINEKVFEQLVLAIVKSSVKKPF